MNEQKSPQEEAAPGPAADSGEFAPVGTMAVMAILAAVIIGLWLFVYFAVYLSRGAVS